MQEEIRKQIVEKIMDAFTSNHNAERTNDRQICRITYLSFIKEMTSDCISLTEEEIAEYLFVNGFIFGRNDNGEIGWVTYDDPDMSSSKNNKIE